MKLNLISFLFTIIILFGTNLENKIFSQKIGYDAIDGLTDYVDIDSATPSPLRHHYTLKCRDTKEPTKRRLLIFFGTRPEVIKMAPIIRLLALNKYTQVDYKIVFTGQHPDLVEPFLKFWNIHVDVHIPGTFTAGQSLNTLLSVLIGQLEAHIPACSEDIYLVQGDATSALAAAMVAFHRNLPVVHIEAGLRSFDMKSPFPEEMNRVTISRCTTHSVSPCDSPTSLHLPKLTQTP